MRNLVVWGLAMSLAVAPTIANAQGDSRRGAVMRTGQGAAPRMQTHMPAGGWSGQRPPQGGNWSGGPRPGAPTPPAGGWNNGPRPGGPPPGGWSGGGWNNGPRPGTPPAGGWNNGPRPGNPPGGGWNGGPRPGNPPAGGWNGGPRPGNPPAGGWHNGPRPGRPGGWVGHGNWGNQGNWGGHQGQYWRPHRGRRLPVWYIAPSFYISDWGYYGLGDPGYGRNWVRYYDDAVLVDGQGTIYDSRYGMDWDRYHQGPVPDYVGDDDYREGWRDDAPRPGYGYAPQPNVYHVAPGGTTTIVIQSAPVVTTTTTTTTYVEESYVAPRRAARPARSKIVRRAAPRACNCR